VKLAFVELKVVKSGRQSLFANCFFSTDLGKTIKIKMSKFQGKSKERMLFKVQDGRGWYERKLKDNRQHPPDASACND